MYFTLTIIAVAVTQSKGLTDDSCDRIKIENEFYDQLVLWSNMGRPYNLNVHKTTNTLFFSYSVDETYSDFDFQLAQLNMDTKEYITIPGIKGGCATAIDHANEEVYLGGSDGIYKYNMGTKLADLYKEKDRNIWSLFYRRNLFYVSYPEQKLHMEVDGKFAVVKEFQDFEIDQFYTSIDGTIYFANNSGFYRYDREKLVAELIHDLITIRQITEDNAGKLYACTNFGLFVIRESFDKVSNLKNIYGLAFDKENNFIMSDDRRVMKLLKSNKTCGVDEHW